MNLLDGIIILAALAYAFTGFRNGAVVGALPLVGFFAGAILGAQIAEPLGSHLAHGRAQVPVAIWAPRIAPAKNPTSDSAPTTAPLRKPVNA